MKFKGDIYNQESISTPLFNFLCKWPINAGSMGTEMGWHLKGKWMPTVATIGETSYLISRQVALLQSQKHWTVLSKIILILAYYRAMSTHFHLCLFWTDSQARNPRKNYSQGVGKTQTIILVFSRESACTWKHLAWSFVFSLKEYIGSPECGSNRASKRPKHCIARLLQEA